MPCDPFEIDFIGISYIRANEPDTLRQLVVYLIYIGWIKWEMEKVRARASAIVESALNIHEACVWIRIRQH